MKKRTEISVLHLFIAIAVLSMSLTVPTVPVHAQGLFSISGTISPASGVTAIMFNNGSMNYPAAIAPDGMSYAITGIPEGAAGTVTATAAAGFTVEPVGGYPGLVVNSDLSGLNFNATPVTLTISGNTGVPSALITVSGSDPVVADATGNYLMRVPYNWSGTIAPAHMGYVFSPASQDFSGIQSDQSASFVATPVSCTVSGNTGVPGALIEYSGGSPFAADDSGAYRITLPCGWTGTVIPSSPGFVFIPESQSFADVQSDLTQDFSAAAFTGTPMPTMTETPVPPPTFTPVPTETAIPTGTSVPTAIEPTATLPIIPSPTVPVIPSPTMPAISNLVINSPPAVGPGLYDDTSTSVQYTGKWTLYRNTSPINRTDHYTNAAGATASLTFNGTKVEYVYLTYKTRGHVRITIDGSVMTDLNAYSPTFIWKVKWTSPDLAPGVHTITITQLDSYIDLDAFIISSSEPAVPTMPATAIPTEIPVFIPTATMVIPNTPTMIPTTAPTQVPTTVPTSSGKVVFSADFETGDFSAFDGSAGEIFGKGTFYEHKIVNEPANGGYASALTIGSGDSTAAYLFTYAVPSTPLGVYSVDLYIPSSVTPADWWQVWQWKSSDTTYNMPIIHLNALRQSSGGLAVTMFYTPGGTNSNPTQKIAQTNPVSFPTDRWVNLTGYYYAAADNTGYVRIYQDGVLIYDIAGFLTKPGNKSVFWSVNSYADAINPNPATIYFDNIRIAEG